MFSFLLEVRLLGFLTVVLHVKIATLNSSTNRPYLQIIYLNSIIVKVKVMTRESFLLFLQHTQRSL